MKDTTQDMPVAVTEDLYEWEDKEDVPGILRDLPAKYGIKESDLGLSFAPVELKERMEDEDEKIRNEAKRKGQAIYFFILNLMRLESGLPYTSKTPDSWSLAELRGKKNRTGFNFGNDRQRSDRNQADDHRYEQAKDAEPGVFFRLLGHKNNFFVVLESLRFSEAQTLTPVAQTRNTQAQIILKNVMA